MLGIQPSSLPWAMPGGCNDPFRMSVIMLIKEQLYLGTCQPKGNKGPEVGYAPDTC